MEETNAEFRDGKLLCGWTTVPDGEPIVLDEHVRLYLGKPGDAMLIWEKGEDITLAPPGLEARFTRQSGWDIEVWEDGW